MRSMRHRLRLEGKLAPVTRIRDFEPTPIAEPIIATPKRPRVKSFAEPMAAFWRQRYMGCLVAQDASRVTILNLHGIEERLPRCEWLTLVSQRYVDDLLMRIGKTDIEVAV